MRRLFISLFLGTLALGLDTDSQNLLKIIYSRPMDPI
jgi:hypothetical protein